MLEHCRDYTEMIFKTEWGEYTVRRDFVEMNIDQLYNEVIKPLLLAAGYGEALIDDYFSEGA